MLRAWRCMRDREITLVRVHHRVTCHRVGLDGTCRLRNMSHEAMHMTIGPIRRARESGLRRAPLLWVGRALGRLCLSRRRPLSPPGELWAFAMLHVHVGCVDVGLRAVRARRMICFPLHESCSHHSHSRSELKLAAGVVVFRPGGVRTVGAGGWACACTHDTSERYTHTR